MRAASKTPGLKWIRRRKGWTPYWIPTAADVKRGFRPKSVNLRSVADSPAELKRRCIGLQSELLTWRCGLKTTLADFDGSIRSLARLYQTHPESSFHDLRPASRLPYLTYLARIDRELGDRTVTSVNGLDLKRWHGDWSKGGKRLSASRMTRAVLNSAVKFGVEARLSGCDQLLISLKAANTKIPNPRRREHTVTADDVVRLRAAAHAAGRPSMALAYALVFETTLRLWDVIGQWWPMDSTPVTDVADKKRGKWFGIRWEDIDDHLVLRYVPSKTSAKTGLSVTFPLSKAPMVMDELAIQQITENEWPQNRRTGPMIVMETTGLPYTSNQFRERWRLDREAVGISKHIWARDLRASGISEGRAAAVATDDVAKVAGHASTKTTSAIYDRATLEAAGRFAEARAKRRGDLARENPTSASVLTREQLEGKLDQASHIFTILLGDRLETGEGRRLLDYFSQPRFDPQFLPWPRFRLPTSR